MTTQYTTILKLALPVQGELSGTWGDVVNDNITQMVEQAVAGKAVINTWTGNSHTLTTADGTTSESRCAILELTDSGTALTGAGTVVCPTNTKLYIVDNNTAEIITVQTVAGTGVAVPVGKTKLVYCDGTNVVEGVTHANSLSLGTSTVTADKILDEDNMASDSATAIATQQSIKAYVDSQVGTVDTLSEILANGNTTGANDIDVDSAQKVQFRDAAIYINSSVDGQLDIVADGEVQIDTALVDINGNLDVSGTTNISGSVSFTKNAIAGVAISTTSRSSNTVTVTTSAVHGLTSGDLVNVNGVADTSFNGYFTVSVSSTTVFTYNQTGADGSSTGGTSTEVVYNLNASGTALNWMNGPLNIAANSGIDGLEITQSGSGEALSITGGNAIFGDNDKAVFGAGSDLQIYSDGTTGQVTGNVSVTGRVAANGAAATAGLAVASDGSALNTIQAQDTRALAADVGGAFVFQALQDGAGTLGTTAAIVSGRLNATSGNTQGYLTFLTGQSGGLTEGMRLDASGNVGIGTASPISKCQVNGANNGDVFYITSSDVEDDRGLMFSNSSNGIVWDLNAKGASSTQGELTFSTNSTERMRIDSSGNVGIGTSSPNGKLAVIKDGSSGANNNTTDSAIVISSSAGAAVNMPLALRYTGIGLIGISGQNYSAQIVSSSVSANNLEMFTTGASSLVLGTAATERMRLDASGNLLVGKTSSDTNVEGSVLFADSSSGASAAFTSDGIRTIIANRKTDDGEIISIRKDGTTVGSIGSISGVVSYINLDPRSGGTGIAGTNTDSIIPVTGTGAVADGTKDLGLTTARWRNLYLSGGVYLGGTAAANKLDSYEEGNWTPVLASDAVAAGYTTQVGKYTKIGNVVNVSFNVQMSSIGSFAGAVITVTGLPFTAANNACEEIGTVNVKSPASALAGVSYLRVLNNGTEARLEQNSGTTTADHNCNANKIDTGTLLQGSITYLTA